MAACGSDDVLFVKEVSAADRAAAARADAIDLGAGVPVHAPARVQTCVAGPGQLVQRPAAPPGLLQAVFAALRPPDGVAPAAAAPEVPDAVRPRRPSAQPAELPNLGPRIFSLTFLTELLQLHDIVDHICRRSMSRGDLMRLAFTCRAIRGPVMKLLSEGGPLSLSSPLGLFSTNFGRANDCRLFKHQHRSLRVMAAAEDPPGWEFGQLRGGEFQHRTLINTYVLCGAYCRLLYYRRPR